MLLLKLLFLRKNMHHTSKYIDISVNINVFKISVWILIHYTLYIASRVYRWFYFSSDQRNRYIVFSKPAFSSESINPLTYQKRMAIFNYRVFLCLLVYCIHIISLLNTYYTTIVYFDFLRALGRSPGRVTENFYLIYDEIRLRW